MHGKLNWKARERLTILFYMWLNRERRVLMKTVALVPIKLNLQRLPHKNILNIAGKPLCWHICNTLCSVKMIDEVYVYCSDEIVKEYISQEAIFKRRSESLDADEVKGFDIYLEINVKGN